MMAKRTVTTHHSITKELNQATQQKKSITSTISSGNDDPTKSAQQTAVDAMSTSRVGTMNVARTCPSTTSTSAAAGLGRGRGRGRGGVRARPLSSASVANNLPLLNRNLCDDGLPEEDPARMAWYKSLLMESIRESEALRQENDQLRAQLEEQAHWIQQLYRDVVLDRKPLEGRARCQFQRGHHLHDHHFHKEWEEEQPSTTNRRLSARDVARRPHHRSRSHRAPRGVSVNRSQSSSSSSSSSPLSPQTSSNADSRSQRSMTNTSRSSSSSRSRTRRHRHHRHHRHHHHHRTRSCTAERQSKRARRKPSSVKKCDDRLNTTPSHRRPTASQSISRAALHQDPMMSGLSRSTRPHTRSSKREPHVVDTVTAPTSDASTMRRIIRRRTTPKNCGGVRARGSSTASPSAAALLLADLMETASAMTSRSSSRTAASCSSFSFSDADAAEAASLPPYRCCSSSPSSSSLRRWCRVRERHMAYQHFFGVTSSSSSASPSRSSCSLPRNDDDDDGGEEEEVPDDVPIPHKNKRQRRFSPSPKSTAHQRSGRRDRNQWRDQGKDHGEGIALEVKTNTLQQQPSLDNRLRTRETKNEANENEMHGTIEDEEEDALSASSATDGPRTFGDHWSHGLRRLRYPALAATDEPTIEPRHSGGGSSPKGSVDHVLLSSPSVQTPCHSHASDEATRTATAAASAKTSGSGREAIHSDDSTSMLPPPAKNDWKGGSMEKVVPAVGREEFTQEVKLSEEMKDDKDEEELSRRAARLAAALHREVEARHGMLEGGSRRLYPEATSHCTNVEDANNQKEDNADIGSDEEYLRWKVQLNQRLSEALNQRSSRNFRSA